MANVARALLPVWLRSSWERCLPWTPCIKCLDDGLLISSSSGRRTVPEALNGVCSWSLYLWQIWCFREASDPLCLRRMPALGTRGGSSHQTEVLLATTFFATGIICMAWPSSVIEGLWIKIVGLDDCYRSLPTKIFYSVVFWSILNTSFLTRWWNACSQMQRGLSLSKEVALARLHLEMMRKNMAGESMVKL